MTLAQLLEDVGRRDWQSATASDGTVRFAMVGLGWWTREEAIPAVADTELCETTVVVSSDGEKAERVADDAGAETGLTYEEFHDGAAADAYDAVYVCTPNATHLEHVRAAADLGKDVLCEKPMERSHQRARRLVEACDDAGVTLMIAYRMHTEPLVRRAREIVDAGAIGEPALVHGSMAQPLMELVPDPDQWRLDPELAGPGTSVTDIGVYPLNTARFVLGSDPVSVTAQMASDGAEFDDVPDERVTWTIRFDDGVHAACTASQRGALSSHLRIVGTEGQLLVEPAFFPWEERSLTVTVDETTVEAAVAEVNQMEEEFAYFADRLLTGRAPHATGEHGLVDMAAIEAIYEAGRRGELVAVEA